MIKVPTIKCKSFVLRQLNKKDVESLAKYANNKNVFKNLTDHFPSPYTLKDSKNFISKTISPKNTSHYAFGIEVEGEVAGVISLVLKTKHKASFGYWLGEPFWGRGIMTEAVKKVTDFGFKNLKLKRIYAGVYPFNLASASVLIKNGFEKEGYLRKEEFHMGKMIDTILFAKVR